MGTKWARAFLTLPPAAQGALGCALSMPAFSCLARPWTETHPLPYSCSWGWTCSISRLPGHLWPQECLDLGQEVKGLTI